jgi:hypothetical protein
VQLPPLVGVKTLVVRGIVRAPDAAGLPTALVALKLNCRNRLGDLTFAARLQEENPHSVNVVHVDPPAARDLDHHHGAAFRAGKYNIGYFVWELPEFPDTWTPSFDYFDEICAECMYLGKPVITADWSATAGYVTVENGCPVRAPLVALDRHHGPYAKGSTWADPDPAHAAAHMRTLFADRALAARLGAAARATIEHRFAPAVIGARYRRRLETIATF